MNALTRAVLYLKRHPIKSAILTGLLLCISMALGILIALHTSLQMDINRLSHHQEKQFLMTTIEEEAPSTASAASQTELEKIVAAYQLTATHLIAEEVNIASDQSENSRFYSLVNQDFFENSQLLEKQEFLETGTYPTQNSIGQVLVSRTLADKYNLKVGEHLTIRSKAGQTHDLTIVGIFKGERLPIVSKESHSLENNLVTTKETIAQVNPNYRYHTSIYEAKTKSLAIQAQAALAANSAIGQVFQTKPNTSVQTHLKTLNNQQQLIRVVAWGTLLLSHLILLFFLHLWMKGRQLEIGILQSLGKSRLEIVLQYVIEVFILASITLVIGLFVTAIALPHLRESLMQDMIKTSYANTDNGEWLPAVFLANHHRLEELLRHPVGVGIVDGLMIVGSGLALSVGAVLVSCLALLKHSPKKIFAMMS